METTQLPAPATTEKTKLKPSEIMRLRGHNPSPFTFMGPDGSVCLVGSLYLAKTEGIECEEDMLSAMDELAGTPIEEEIQRQCLKIAHTTGKGHTNHLTAKMVCYDINNEWTEEEVIGLLEKVGL